MCKMYIKQEINRVDKELMAGKYNIAPIIVKIKNDVVEFSRKENIYDVGSVIHKIRIDLNKELEKLEKEFSDQL